MNHYLCKRSNKDKYIRRPLAVGILFYILGLIGGELHYNMVQLSLFFIAIIVVISLMLLHYRNIYVLLYLLPILIGIWSIANNQILKEENIFSSKENEVISIMGKVLEVREYDYKNQYIIRPHKGRYIKSKIQIETGKDAKLAKEGDIIELVGKINPLGFPRNPGSFNERSYMLIRGITTKIKADEINIKQNTRGPSIVSKVQNYYSQMFEKIMPDNEAQIMKAMLLGDKVFLSKEIQNLYKDVGIAHVLAISGLHISIIAGVLWWILKRLGISDSVQSMVIIILLWMYAYLTGFSISITRSATMMSVIIIAKLLDEKPDPITSWGFAALVLLLYNNLYLWDIGFQLSFIAVGSLIIISPLINTIYYIPKKIRSYIAPLIAVTIGTTPIIAYHYYIISPIGLIMNLLLVPLIIIVVSVGFIAMLILPFGLVFPKIVIGSAYYLLKLVEKISTLALKIPFSTLIIGRPSKLELIVYLILTLSILLYLTLDIDKRKRGRYYLLVFNACLLAFICIQRLLPGELRVTFLDVGQGDSIVITSPNHKTFVIDGGIKGNGKKIEQFLKYNGIRKVDGLILSHAHADHMDGLGELALSYPIERLFLSELPLEDDTFKAFYDIILSVDIPLHIMEAGDSIKDEDIIIECIYPFRNLESLKGNNRSLVLSLKHGQISYYFTGDIEEHYEIQMSKHISSNSINILKVPHHGSKTSSTQELIDASNPDLAIISCGKNNLYKHPHPDIVERYKENDVPIKITKDVGAIMTYSDGKRLRIDLMEDKRMLWK